MAWGTPIVNWTAGQGFDYINLNRIEANIKLLGGNDDLTVASTEAATPYALCRRNSSGGLAVIALTAASASISGAVTIGTTLGVAGVLSAASVTISGGAAVGGNISIVGGISAGSASISGALWAASAALGATTANSMTISGALSAASAAIYGALSAGSISAGSISVGDISGGSATITGAFGCNGKAAQGKYAGGGDFTGGQAGTFNIAFTTADNGARFLNLVHAIYYALIADGIMS